MHSRTRTRLFPPGPANAADMTRAIHVAVRAPRPERFAANEEPALEDLLSDPITHRLMASDGLPGDAVLAEVERARARLSGGSTGA